MVFYGIDKGQEFVKAQDYWTLTMTWITVIQNEIKVTDTFDKALRYDMNLMFKSVGAIAALFQHLEIRVDIIASVFETRYDNEDIFAFLLFC